MLLRGEGMEGREVCAASQAGNLSTYLLYGHVAYRNRVVGDGRMNIPVNVQQRAGYGGGGLSWHHRTAADGGGGDGVGLG